MPSDTLHFGTSFWLKFQQGVFAKMPPKKLNTFLKIPILNGIVKKKILKGLGLDSVHLLQVVAQPQFQQS